MSPRLVTFLIFMCPATNAAGWPWTTTSSPTTDTEPLPKWVSNLEHPWVSQHRSSLASCHEQLGEEAFLSALCVPDTTDVYLGGLERPPDLFRTVSIDAHELHQLSNCEHALATVQILKLSFGHARGSGDLSPALVAEAFALSPNLRDIRLAGSTWFQALDEEALLEAEFAKLDKKFPKLERLVCRPCVPALVSRAPNLRELKCLDLVNYWFPNLDADYDEMAIRRCAELAPNLQSLSLSSNNLGPHIIRGQYQAVIGNRSAILMAPFADLIKSNPRLSYLGLGGRFADNWSEDTGGLGANLKVSLC